MLPVFLRGLAVASKYIKTQHGMLCVFSECLCCFPNTFLTPEYDFRVRKCRKRAAKEGAQEMCVFEANPLGARAFTGALVGDAWSIGFPKSIGFCKEFSKNT